MSAALHSLLRSPPGPALRRGQRSSPLAFIAIGGGGALALVMLSSLMIGLHTGLANWLVNTLSYAALIGPIYLLHHRFSFSSEAAHRRAMPRYLAVQGMALMLTAGFSYCAHQILGLPAVPASILVVGLTASVNYLVLRHWAFGLPQVDRAVPA